LNALQGRLQRFRLIKVARRQLEVRTFEPGGVGRIAHQRANALSQGGELTDKFPSVANGDIGDIEWLGVNVAIHQLGKKLAERIRVDVGQSEVGFAQVLAGALVIVVISPDVGLSAGRRIPLRGATRFVPRQQELSQWCPQPLSARCG